jgi:hypothetical protein
MRRQAGRRPLTEALIPFANAIASAAATSASFVA